MLDLETFTVLAGQGEPVTRQGGARYSGLQQTQMQGSMTNSVALGRAATVTYNGRQEAAVPKFGVAQGTTEI